MTQEISDLDPATSTQLTDELHIKQGSVDRRISLALLFNDHVNSAGAHPNITASSLGLGNVLNIPQLAIANNLSEVNPALARGNLSVPSVAEMNAAIGAHSSNVANPHNVDKTQVGLGNVANYPPSDSVTTDSSSQYATSRAVKTVYDQLQAIISAVVPIGAVIMWHGAEADIPTGFVKCDGTNGTPDFYSDFGRYPRAAIPSRPPGYVGGQNAVSHSHPVSVAGHSLTEDQMPRHAHGMIGEVSSQHSLFGIDDNFPRDVHAGLGKTNFDNSIWNSSFKGGNSATGNTPGNGLPHTHSASTSNTQIDTQPPYVTVHFIKRIA